MNTIEIHAVVGSDGSWVHIFEDREQAEAFCELNGALLFTDVPVHDAKDGQDLVDEYEAMR